MKRILHKILALSILLAAISHGGIVQNAQAKNGTSYPNNQVCVWTANVDGAGTNGYIELHARDSNNQPIGSATQLYHNNHNDFEKNYKDCYNYTAPATSFTFSISISNPNGNNDGSDDGAWYLDRYYLLNGSGQTIVDYNPNQYICLSTRSTDCNNKGVTDQAEWAILKTKTKWEQRTDIAPPQICSGQLGFVSSPSSGPNGAQVTMTTSGLSSCDGKTASFRQDSCTGPQIASCSVSGAGCSASGAVTGSPGYKSLYACVDKNANGTFDTGERVSNDYTITSQPAQTCPSGQSGNPCAPTGGGGGGTGANYCENRNDLKNFGDSSTYKSFNDTHGSACYSACSNWMQSNNYTGTWMDIGGSGANCWCVKDSQAVYGGSQPGGYCAGGGTGGSSQCPEGETGTPPNCTAGTLSPPPTYTNPTAFGTVEEALASITFWLYIFAVPILSLMILYGGFLIMTSGGQEERYGQGIKTIRWGVIGFIVVLLSAAIAAVVQSVLG